MASRFEEYVVVPEAGDDLPRVIEAFVAGDEAALAEIYARWSSLVYSVALRSIVNVSDAEQVTQHVFTEVWTSRHTFDPTRAKLQGWLIEITRTKIADLQARSGQAPLRSKVDALTPAEDMIEPTELANRLLLADEMSRLAATPQKVLRMALHTHLTHAEIAERLGLTPGAVKSHIRRSLLKLRERLEVRADAY